MMTLVLLFGGLTVVAYFVFARSRSTIAVPYTVDQFSGGVLCLRLIFLSPWAVVVLFMLYKIANGASMSRIYF